MKSIDEINKFFEQYLEEGEVIEYITQRTVFPEKGKISFVFMLFFFILMFIFMLISGAGVVPMVFMFIVFGAIAYFTFYTAFINPYHNFSECYYCITNKRLMKYSNFLNIFNQQSIDLVHHVNVVNFHDVVFTNKYHLILFEFKEVPDSKEVCEFMKGKIKQ